MFTLLLVFSFDSTRLVPTIYYTRGEHANHHTTNVVEKLEGKYVIV